MISGNPSRTLLGHSTGIRLGLDSSLLGSQFAPYQTRYHLVSTGAGLPGKHWDFSCGKFQEAEDCSLAGHGLWGEASANHTGFLMSGATHFSQW